MKIIAPVLEKSIEAIDDAGSLLLKNELIRNVHATTCTIANEGIKAGEIDQCKLQKVDFTEAILEKLAVKDTFIKGGSLVACNLTDTGWHYAEITDTRCSGALFQMSKLKHVVFRDCKLDLVNFRYAKLENVLFDNCQLNDTDFYNAELRGVVFDNCTIEKIELSAAKFSKVDFSSSELGIVQGITSMKGATVSPLQLISLAPYMANELGLMITSDS